MSIIVYCLWKLLFFLPTRYRMKAIQKLVLVPNATKLNHLIFKVAETQDELEQAFSLQAKKDAKKPANLDKNFAGLNRHYMLPTSTVLIAKTADNEVVATLTIVLDSLFGFPLESHVDTSRFRSRKLRIAELFQFATSPLRLNMKFAVSMFLFNYAYRYAVQYLGIDCFLIATTPKKLPLLQAIFYFRPVLMKNAADLSNKIGAYLDLRSAYRDYKNTYQRNLTLSTHQTLFEFFTEPLAVTAEFPKSETPKVRTPKMSPETLDYFFNQKTSLFSELTPSEIQVLCSHYRDGRYQSILPARNERIIFMKKSRRHPRFQIEFTGEIAVSGRKERVNIRLVNVSKGGFRAVLDAPIRFGDSHHFSIHIGTSNKASVQAFPTWSDNELSYGFKIEMACQNWHRMIDGLAKNMLSAGNKAAH